MTWDLEELEDAAVSLRRDDGLVLAATRVDDATTRRAPEVDEWRFTVDDPGTDGRLADHGWEIIDEEHLWEVLDGFTYRFRRGATGVSTGDDGVEPDAESSAEPATGTGHGGDLPASERQSETTGADADESTPAVGHTVGRAESTTTDSATADATNPTPDRATGQGGAAASVLERDAPNTSESSAEETVAGSPTPAGEPTATSTDATTPEVTSTDASADSNEAGEAVSAATGGADRSSDSPGDRSRSVTADEPVDSSDRSERRVAESTTDTARTEPDVPVGAGEPATDAEPDDEGANSDDGEDEALDGERTDSDDGEDEALDDERTDSDDGEDEALDDEGTDSDDGEDEALDDEGTDSDDSDEIEPDDGDGVSADGSEREHPSTHARRSSDLETDEKSDGSAREATDTTDRGDRTAHVRIREASSDDAERLAAVYRNAYAENRELGFPASAESVTSTMVRAWIDEKAVIVAAAEDTVVGGLRLAATTPDRVEVSRLGVAPDWKRRGIGSKLLAAAEAAVAAGSAETIWLTIPEDHPYLPAFYRDHGYERTEEASLDDREYDEVVMEKSVA
ncbi:GNAT family N-acetyltransferase [Halovivax cerinus]|uniref:GNAT family N-acetyltransferase n=1 Tax=Halovivax cerinus TaxID=1487865 RepID=A0ABD5NK78_9EURY|nr:GNAT family N-acetyltransferase [Halovivax cerinus]